MFNCSNQACGKQAQFYCECSQNLSIFCEAHIAAHKNQQGRHNIKAYQPPTNQIICNELLLQFKHLEEEVIKITSERLQEINRQSTSTLLELGKMKKEVIACFNAEKLIQFDFKGIQEKVNSMMCEFYEEIYKYTLKENRKPNLAIELSDGTYMGDLNDNEIPHGSGIKLFKNGDSYEGQFRIGIMHGLGVFYYRNGDVYRGEWANGYRQGKGEMIYNNGSKYVGSWLKNNKDGYGTQTIFDGPHKGDCYEGEWKDDLQNGKGINHVKDERFEGDFSKGNMHGMINHVFPNGESVYEVYEDGQLANEN